MNSNAVQTSSIPLQTSWTGIAAAATTTQRHCWRVESLSIAVHSSSKGQRARRKVAPFVFDSRRGEFESFGVRLETSRVAFESSRAVFDSSGQSLESSGQSLESSRQSPESSRESPEPSRESLASSRDAREPSCARVEFFRGVLACFCRTREESRGATESSRVTLDRPGARLDSFRVKLDSLRVSLEAS